MTAILGAADFPAAAPDKTGTTWVDPALSREDGPLQVLRSPQSGGKP